MKELKTREEVEAIKALESEVIEAAVRFAKVVDRGDTIGVEELLDAVDHLVAARE